MIDDSTRLFGVDQVISSGHYFTIHAPRQSGKTTYLQSLTKRINTDQKYRALYCSLEGIQGVDDSDRGIPAIVKTIKNAIRFSSLPQAMQFAENADYDDYTNVLHAELTLYAKALDKPFVIFFDEVDCLSEKVLVSFLRQLRVGYNNRGTTPFVHAIALAGMRNIRDFKAKEHPEHEIINTYSPVGVLTKAIQLKYFTQDEITELYQQYTAETKQTFEPDAVELIRKQTQGQPWLVNAIAREITGKTQKNKSHHPITAEMALAAIQTIILRRDIYIDNLLEKLKEERVQTIIEAIILGEIIDVSTDDFHYTRDLGLIRNNHENIELANPIYAEVIMRTLTCNLQNILQHDNPAYRIPRYRKDKSVNMNRLMLNFQQFWQDNSALWIERFQYKGAAPYLILIAYLQRVFNGTGRIALEMAAGTGQTNLCIIYEKCKYPVELKTRRSERTLDRSIKQTAQYAAHCACTQAWLVLFDRRPEMTWNEKIYTKTVSIDDKTINVVGA
jgi:hypothetical protein